MTRRTDPDRLQRVLDALSSPIRRDILWLVWDEERAAGEIARAFAVRAPTISEHLTVLREAGLVTMRRDGTFRRYRAVPAAVAGLREVLAADNRKWEHGGTPMPLAPGRTVGVVVVVTSADCDQDTAFRAFTDAAIYQRWAGVPVSIVDGHFSATMEWGLAVRGTYDHVVPPSLIVMTWDFEPDQVPIPGEAQRAYLEIRPEGTGCRAEVHQLVRSTEQAAYMERVWGLMLARFRDHVLDAVNPSVEMPLRPRRERSPRVAD